MKEIDQAVLPVGQQDTCGIGVTFGKTRVWAYETSDTKNGKILGSANWPSVTVEARRGHPTQATYVNQLPSFNPADPDGPGLVQGLAEVDQTLHWADPLGTGCGMPIDCTLPENANNLCCQEYTGPEPNTVHLHGAEIAACYDGGPDTWFTPAGQTGPQYCTDNNPGPGKDIYTYDNSQEPGTLWFHDHALGATSSNVYAGLAGFYFLRDPSSEPKKLPSGPYEIELALQDRLFDTNSQLMNLPATTPHFHPYWIVRFLGDVATVNGAAFPYLKVEPRRYRFRVLDGANGRRFDLKFGGAPVWEIGGDDNYLDKPVVVNGTACQGGFLPPNCPDVSLLPGQRADIIVDFTKLAGQTITLTNLNTFELPLKNIMQFRVVLPLTGRDKSCDPANPNPVNGFCARRIPTVRLTDGHGHLAPGVKIDKIRQLTVVEASELINGNKEIEEFLNNTKWNGLLSPSIQADFPIDGVSELPREGSTELWEIINFETVESAYHPIHVHLTQFQILNRQFINAEGYEAAYDAAFGNGPAPLPNSCAKGEYCPGYGPPLDYLTPNDDGALGGNPAISPFLICDPIPPDPGETGWLDSAKSFPLGEVLRIVVRWTPSNIPVIANQSYAGQNLYSFDPTQREYVWHCHLLGHEDNEMMRPYKVVK